MLETNVSERYRRTWEGEVRREKLKRKCVMRIVFVYAVHLVNGRCGLVRLKDMIARSLLSDSGGGGDIFFEFEQLLHMNDTEQIVWLFQWKSVILQ